tara:strand:- start:115 stop:303 length:189 start_codon:yes stop_codon:yes gene_type:complete
VVQAGGLVGGLFPAMGMFHEVLFKTAVIGHVGLLIIFIVGSNGYRHVGKTFFLQMLWFFFGV